MEKPFINPEYDGSQDLAGVSASLAVQTAHSDDALEESLWANVWSDLDWNWLQVWKRRSQDS